MRLSDATVHRLPAAVARPGYDRSEQRRGIVHLGIGAFHRGHQAVYTDEAMGGGDRDWAITGVSLRSANVRDMLTPQDGLYTVTERSPAGERTRLIAAVAGVLVGDEAVAALAAPDTRIVTLTITEKGYHRASDGTLDRAAVDATGNTIYHHLSRAFARRRDAGLPGLTLLSCDNLASNGAVLSRALSEYLDPALRAWFLAECTCPSTMVDRIVPAATGDGLDRTAAQIGLRDEGAIATEPFRQWVIEDRFAGPRPRWETVGVKLVADVQPYETAKLRMLNGAHSALAYLGLRSRYCFVHEAIADPAIRELVERLMRQEAAASIDPAPSQDLSAYADSLIDRFRNAALPHSLNQIAMDGSQKIEPRWLQPLAINRAQGTSTPATLRALAAWVVFVRGDCGTVEDPLATQLADLWDSAGEHAIAAALFGFGGVFTAQCAFSESELAELGRLIGATSQGVLRPSLTIDMA